MMYDQTPLCELANQRQPRRKQTYTYGKRKAGHLSSQRVHQEIFAYEEDDLATQLELIDFSEGTKEISAAKAVGRSVKALGHAPIQPVENQSTAEVDVKHSGLQQLLALSGTDEIEEFTTFGNKLSKLFEVDKIGEGSFAEVFKITSQDPDFSQHAPKTPGSGRSRANYRSTAQCTRWRASNYTSIIKIIPLLQNSTPPTIVDRCSTVDSIVHEINILKQLDPIHGFARYRGLRLVSGLWPDAFLDAYRTFKARQRKRAINAPPNKDFDSTQIYALVEMDDAGSEISLIKRPSVFQVWDIFWISTILLANAEECIEFEHRDLHMSNLCVKPAPGAGIMSDVSERHAEHDEQHSQARQPSVQKRTAQQQPVPDADLDLLLALDKMPEKRIGLSNLRVTIIDYTVARARLASDGLARDSKSSVPPELGPETTRDYKAKDEEIIFDHLKFTSDPFNSSADDVEAYLQNLTYKKTRAIAIRNLHLRQQHAKAQTCAHAPRKKAKGQVVLEDESPSSQVQSADQKWRAFIPQTNTIWLGYLLRILIRRARASQTGRLYLLAPSKTKSTVRGRISKADSKRTCKGGMGTSTLATSIVKTLQESMWDILLDASRLLNGADHRDVEDASLPKLPETNNTDHGGDDDAENDDGDAEEPQWKEAELDCLPNSALHVLDLAVSKGWLSLEEIQAFRKVIEEESS